MNENLYAIVALLILSLVITLIRLPFSEEKRGRLKCYGIGVLLVSLVIGMYYFAGWFTHLSWVEHFMPDHIASIIDGICAIVGIFAALLYFVCMFGWIIGAGMCIFFAPLADDFSIWSEFSR